MILNLYLAALGMAFQVNVVLFQSTVENCYIVNQVQDVIFDETLYFLRTESKHVDPVVKNSFDSFEIEDSSGDEIQITGVIEGTEDIKYSSIHQAQQFC